MFVFCLDTDSYLKSLLIFFKQRNRLSPFRTTQVVDKSRRLKDLHIKQRAEAYKLEQERDEIRYNFLWIIIFHQVYLIPCAKEKWFLNEIHIYIMQFQFGLKSLLFVDFVEGKQQKKWSGGSNRSRFVWNNWIWSGGRESGRNSSFWNRSGDPSVHVLYVR